MSDRWHRSRLAQLEPTFAWDGRVDFPDVDAAGIVFFATIQAYFHQTLVRFLHHVEQPLWDQLRSGTGLAPIVHAEADYLRPLRFGDPFRAGVVDAEVTTAKVTLGYRLDGPSGPAAVGSMVHVWVEPRTFRQAPLPDELRAAFGRATARNP